MCFDSNFTEVYSSMSSLHNVSIGSGNGLAPDRRQAIYLYQCRPGPVTLNIASLGQNEFSTTAKIQANIDLVSRHIIF